MCQTTYTPILNTYQLNQYAKLRLKTPFLFPNPFVYYKHCYIYIWNDIIQEHEQKTWLNYLFHSINICRWCHFVYKMSTKKIKIHTFLSSWRTNSNEKGDTWVQHFILYNYLKNNHGTKIQIWYFSFDWWNIKYQHLGIKEISISYDLTITCYDTYRNIGATLTHVCFVENKIAIIIPKYNLFSFKKNFEKNVLWKFQHFYK